MKISKKSEYAVRALVELARTRQYGTSQLRIARIAQLTQIPEKFLEQILLVLKHSGWLQSRRGVEGGYTLSVDPDQLTVAMVVRKVEGTPAAPAPSSDDEVAASLLLWLAKAEEAAWSVLERVSIGDLLRESESIRAQRAGAVDYTI